MQAIFGFFVVIILMVVAFSFKPLRKAIGLLLIIMGALVSLTIIGLILGIPAIIIGGVLLFM